MLISIAQYKLINRRSASQNMAPAILAALPLVLVFLFFQRQIIKGIATTGFGGQ